MKNYSCLLFRRNVYGETLEELRKYIQSGTKCYFFSWDPVECVLEDEWLERAMQAHLLFVYETKFDRDLQTEMTCFNGEIQANQLHKLSALTPAFNQEQFLIEHAAADANISISAGAGTGKTTVMINRILFLKYSVPDLDLSEVVLITFTNKAALHMSNKLAERLKTYFYFTKDQQYLKWLLELKKMEIGTIHSFAHTLLQNNRNDGLGSKRLPVSQFVYKRRKIIEQVIDEYHQEHPKLFERFRYIEQYKLIRLIESVMNRLNHYSVSPELIEELDFGGSADGSHEMFQYVAVHSAQRFAEYKEKLEVMDITDLIVNLDSLTEHGQGLAIPYKYLFVDEFQDTDEQQTKFLAFLGSEYPLHIFIVGDIKQSIYRFRGADYTAFEQMKDRLQIDCEFSLQLNYRSDGPLLEAFNELFSAWPEQVPNFPYFEKDYLYAGLPSQQQEDGSPLVFNDLKSRYRLLEFLRKQEGTDTAILVRTNREVNEIALLCEQHHIFYTAERDGDFYRSLVVREFYQLLMRFVHPADWKNRYTLHCSSYGDRSLTVDRAIEHFISDKSASRLLEDADSKFLKYEEKFRHESVMQVLQDIIQEMQPAKVYSERLLQQRLAAEPMSDRLLKMAETAQREYMLNLQHLLYLLKKETEQGIITLNRLESLLRLKMQTDKTITYQKIEEPGDGRLKIMTVHKSKGLEFDYVALPYTEGKLNRFMQIEVLYQKGKVGYRAYEEKGKIFENSLFHSMKREDKQENTGEETRMLYVAMTRAKKKVYADAPEFTNNHEIRRWGDLLAAGRQREKVETVF